MRRLVRPVSRWSIRARLLVALMVVVAAGFAIFGAISSVLLERSQIDRLDAQLALVAGDLSRSVETPPPPVAESDQTPSDFRLLFFDTDGQVMSRLGAPVGESTFPRLPQMTVDDVRARGATAYTVSDERSEVRWRVRTALRPEPDRPGEPASAAVAISMETLDGTISRLRWIGVVVGAALVLVMSAMTVLTVRFGLRPLRDIERTATSIAAAAPDRPVRLEQRVDADEHTEVGRLGAVFNTMLDRLSDAMQRLTASEERMRTFIADASHDLRTPLTAIRGYAELSRHPTVEPAAQAEFLAEIEAAATRMSRLVDDLLDLAAYDEGPVSQTEVDLGAVVRAAAEEYRFAAPDRRVAVHDADRPAMVLGDPLALRRVVGNLIANALVHTGADACVDITFADPQQAGDRAVLASAGITGPLAGDAVEVWVIDNGPGVAEAKAAHVFERFFRADGSRERGAGSGLGLAIVAAIVEAHGGRVELLAAGPGSSGATFRVLLPAATHIRRDESRS